MFGIGGPYSMDRENEETKRLLFHNDIESWMSLGISKVGSWMWMGMMRHATCRGVLAGESQEFCWNRKLYKNKEHAKFNHVDFQHSYAWKPWVSFYWFWESSTIVEALGNCWVFGIGGPCSMDREIEETKRLLFHNDIESCMWLGISKVGSWMWMGMMRHATCRGVLAGESQEFCWNRKLYKNKEHAKFNHVDFQHAYAHEQESMTCNL